MAATDVKARAKAAKAELMELKGQLQALRGARAKTSLSDVAGRSTGGLGPIPRLQDRKRLFGHFGKVYALSWAGDSQTIVSASQDGKLMIWDAEVEARTAAIHLKSAWVMTCAFEMRENNIVAAGGLDNVCSLYSVSDAESGNDKPVQELAHHDGYLSSCSFIGGADMLTASGDSTCVLWDLESGSPKQVLSEHAGDVMALSLCPTNQALFVTGSCDATSKLWDLRTGRAEQTFTGHEQDINTVAFMANGTTFGSGSDDATCRVWDLRSRGPVASFSDPSAMACVISMDFSSSGRMLFVGNDNSGCVVWDTLGSPSTPADTLNCHTNRVSAVSVAPSGQAVATGSWDTTLFVCA